MELFRTVVDIHPSEHKLSYDTGSLWMGSCFTENIGSRLKQLKFPCIVNPFGVLYNPSSIYESLKILIEKRTFTENDLCFGNGLWYSFYHHSSFSGTELESCLNAINKSITEASELLVKAQFLIITFGTARVYRLKDNGRVVSNNHKLPHERFTESIMQVNEIVEQGNEIVQLLQLFNPNLKIILTLSPVRHWKDGATGNLVSKSALMLAMSELSSLYDHVSCFPAYEIVMDELRDYRFYADDMLHIGSKGVDYIWSRFAETYIDPKAFPVMQEIAAICRGVAHRPFNPETTAHQEFLGKLLDRIDQVQRILPGADFSAERGSVMSYYKGTPDASDP